MSISDDRDNPFAPPKATLLEASAPDGNFVEDGRKLPAARGKAWFSEAWALFKRAPGTWVLLFVVFIVVSIVFAIIPLGALVTSVAYPAVAAGVMIGCRDLEQGGDLRMGHLFEGFRKNASSLLLVGGMYLVGAMIAGFVVGVGMALALPMFMAGSAPSGDGFAFFMQMLPVVALVMLVTLALMMPLFMAMWFAPALVAFHDLQPLAAMKASFRGCMRNMVPFLVYGAVGLLLAILAIIPFGLGFLVFGPLMWASMYTGYRDIYLDR